jgi:hypothetical protein
MFEPGSVSIFDKEVSRNALSFDLKDILRALGAESEFWQWWIAPTLEEFGPDPSLVELDRALQQSRPQGLWLSGKQLVALAQGIDQTIDGEFQAFPPEIDPSTISLDELHGPFSASSAVLVIRAVDGDRFDVGYKRLEDRDRLRAAFTSVRNGDGQLRRLP